MLLFITTNKTRYRLFLYREKACFVGVVKLHKMFSLVKEKASPLDGIPQVTDLIFREKKKGKRYGFWRHVLFSGYFHSIIKSYPEVGFGEREVLKE